MNPPDRDSDDFADEFDAYMRRLNNEAVAALGERLDISERLHRLVRDVADPETRDEPAGPRVLDGIPDEHLQGGPATLNVRTAGRSVPGSCATTPCP